jgi:hypothetical protein
MRLSVVVAREWQRSQQQKRLGGGLDLGICGVKISSADWEKGRAKSKPEVGTVWRTNKEKVRGGGHEILGLDRARVNTLESDGHVTVLYQVLTQHPEHLDNDRRTAVRLEEWCTKCYAASL